MGFLSLISGVVKCDQEEAWFWKPELSRGFFDSLTYGILLVVSWVREGRSERVLWSLVRISKNWASSEVVVFS